MEMERKEQKRAGPGSPTWRLLLTVWPWAGRGTPGSPTLTGTVKKPPAKHLLAAQLPGVALVTPHPPEQSVSQRGAWAPDPRASPVWLLSRPHLAHQQTQKAGGLLPRFLQGSYIRGSLWSPAPTPDPGVNSQTRNQKDALRRRVEGDIGIPLAYSY